VAREIAPVAEFVLGAAFVGEGAAAGSQQQPPAGSVRQQQPARLIWAIRPGTVLASAELPSPASNAPMMVARAIQGPRDRAREMAMHTPRKKDATERRSSLPSQYTRPPTAGQTRDSRCASSPMLANAIMFYWDRLRLHTVAAALPRCCAGGTESRPRSLVVQLRHNSRRKWSLLILPPMTIVCRVIIGMALSLLSQILSHSRFSI
jgi:hypothetical protein